jgi:hypothetical protein
LEQNTDYFSPIMYVYQETEDDISEALKIDMRGGKLLVSPSPQTRAGHVARII